MLVLTFAFLSALLFPAGPGRQAHALALPAVAVVAPTVARTVVVPVAQAACRTACRSAITGAAGHVARAAQFACMFVVESCKLPLGQNPDVGVNSDQPIPPPVKGWVHQYPPKLGTDVGPMFGTATFTETGTVQPSYVHPGGVSLSGSAEITCRGAGSTTVTGGSTSQAGTWGFGAAITCTGGLDRVRLLLNASPGGEVIQATYYPPGHPSRPVDATEPENPRRDGQGFRKCRDAAGDVFGVAGTPFVYYESDPERLAEIPACPSGSSPVGGGVAAGSPWTPGAIPAGTGTGTPLVPEWAPPTPEQLPHQPKPGEPTVPRRTPPGTPAEPLPEIDPKTGAPTGSPQPKPGPYVPPITETNPNPEPEGPCMWGGYAVDPADCDGAPEPTPTPTPTQPPLEPEPKPPGDGKPVPESGPNPDSDGCLQATWTWNPVSWVYAPVKCALRWAFVPKPGFVEAKATGVRTEWAGTGPGGIVGAAGGVVTGVGDLAGAAGGCSGPAVNFDTKWLKTRLRPLAACPGDLAHQAAKVVRIITTVGLYLGVAALSTRILASSLGLQLPGFGKGDES